MRTTFTFHTAGQLLFGRYAVRQLPEQMARLKVARVLIVTDAHLERAGILAAVRDPLLAAGVAVDVFTGGEPEPSIELAETVLAQARAFQPEAILGLGGGSNMDLAKIASVVHSHGGGIRDYVGEDKVPGPVLPLVCVPTTSGTGSEVSAASVLTDKANQTKVGILSNYLRPRLALVDPELTLTCPRKVTADSGIDALTHAIEAFTAVDNAEFPLPAGERSTYQGRHPFGDMLAERAIELVGRYLVRACDAPQDYEAREGMALAAVLGGMAFSNVGVAIVHALEYPLGAALHCSHGAGNGLLLPYVMRYNLPPRKREYARIAQLLGADISGLDETAAGEAAITAVEQLRAAIGIPNRLREIGARPEQLAGFAEKAFAIKRVIRVNPRVPTLEDFRGILEAAY
ncbi:MAG: iron-containing alcohol dehydrogenase [Planctomycetales bacterium]|nr:iron-containing alcohol dehydrogenase [Planctomycetales bacterium]MBN8624630.1 iron-containing alcohol dehydrogenase [Planctomycetota bacterium]